MIRTTSLIILLLGLVSCGTVNDSFGGAEAGNPTSTTRNIKGLVIEDSSHPARVQSQSSDTCPADTVIATNSSSQSTQTETADDCSFSLSLTTGRSYSFAFLSGDTFVATLIFTNRPGALTSPTFIVSAGSTDIDLGNVLISGSNATPEFEPAQQNDQDDDGVSDYDDDDDDNDGNGDDDETDCDFDGHLDDYDDDNECSEETESGDDDDEDSTSASILEVNPRNNQINVSIGEDIEVRAGCEINPSSLNNNNFNLASNGISIPCSFEISSSGSIIECEHDELAENTTYTVSLDGLACENGDLLPEITWSFTTEGD